jgi:hypothetical protein
MLLLESLALMSSLGPLGVLGVTLASGVVFSILIARFFKSAHYDELEKHNRMEYFHREQHQQQGAPGTFIAKWGTRIEGAAAAVLLLTLGAFAFDMVAWAAEPSRDYASALPGLFFAQTSLNPIFIAGAVVSGVILLGFCLWVAHCLASAHYALDGTHTIEYYSKKREDKEMRGVLNVQEGLTAKPKYFSTALKWQHKVEHKMEQLFSCDPLPLKNRASAPM